MKTLKVRDSRGYILKVGVFDSGRAFIASTGGKRVYSGRKWVVRLANGTLVSHIHWGHWPLDNDRDIGEFLELVRKHNKGSGKDERP